MSLIASIPCSDALEAELQACLVGLELALSYTPLPILLEVDCAELCKLVQANTEDRSRYMHLVRHLNLKILEVREIRFVHIRRSQNIASDALAKLGVKGSCLSGPTHAQASCWMTWLMRIVCLMPE